MRVSREAVGAGTHPPRLVLRRTVAAEQLAAEAAVMLPARDGELLAAAFAVAVADGHVQAVDLVAHTFAQATSIQWVSHNLWPGKGGASSSRTTQGCALVDVA